MVVIIEAVFDVYTLSFWGPKSWLADRGYNMAARDSKIGESSSLICLIITLFFAPWFCLERSFSLCLTSFNLKWELNARCFFRGAFRLTWEVEAFNWDTLAILLVELLVESPQPEDPDEPVLLLPNYSLPSCADEEPESESSSLFDTSLDRLIIYLKPGWIYSIELSIALSSCSFALVFLSAFWAFFSSALRCLAE